MGADPGDVAWTRGVYWGVTARDNRLSLEAGNKYGMIDSTIVRAYQHSAWALPCISHPGRPQIWREQMSLLKDTLAEAIIADKAYVVCSMRALRMFSIKRYTVRCLPEVSRPILAWGIVALLGAANGIIDLGLTDLALVDALVVVLPFRQLTRTTEVSSLRMPK